MITLSDYEHGRIDVVIEIFSAMQQGGDTLDKMGKMLDKTISILKKFNNKYTKLVLEE